MSRRSDQTKRMESPIEKKERHALERARAKAWSEERKKRACMASAASSSNITKKVNRKGKEHKGSTMSYSIEPPNERRKNVTKTRLSPPSPFKVLFPAAAPTNQGSIADSHTERQVKECQQEVIASIESLEYHTAVQNLSLIFIDALVKNQFKTYFSFDASQAEDFNRILSNYNEDYHNKILEDTNLILLRAGFQVSNVIPVRFVAGLFGTMEFRYDIHVTILSL